jgi:transcription elongation factor
MEIRFKDKVKITEGFYKGRTGIVEDTTESFADGAGVLMYVSYTVRLDTNNHLRVKFASRFLEVINDKKTK